MKIQCKYCDNMFNDTEEKCPNCGAPNEAVVRTTSNQPLTVKELQDWYKEHGLPPYETTRFFIGEDYREPRAFGIYEDERGHFIVYKNKESGDRAVRYDGTDEAYAVNELYQKLKQEILVQKANNLNSVNTTANRQRSGNASAGAKGNAGIPAKNMLFLGGVMAVGLVMTATATMTMLNNSNDSYAETTSYTTEATDTTDITDTTDTESQPDVEGGYYKRGENTYYHMPNSYYDGWFVYDDFEEKWNYVDDYDFLDGLYDQDTASDANKDFYYTPEWDSSLQASDFSDSDAYYDYIENEGSYYDDSKDDSDWDNDFFSDDSDFGWDSSDSWSSDNSDWGSDW